MDAMFEFDNVRAEKANAMQRFNRLRSLAKLFRLAEIFVALLILSWTFARLPFAVKISGEYFKKLFAVIVSPLFVFLLCNAIIASLIAKSGRFSGQNQGANRVEAELYYEIIKNGSAERARPSESENDAQSSATEDIVYDDKEIIVAEANSSAAADQNEEVDSETDSDSDHPKSYRRTQSEKFNRECSVKNQGELRRSETEKFGNVVKSGEDYSPAKLNPQDKLSDEEFNRTVEAFIAKQLKFRRQESLSIVLPNQS